MATTMLPPNPPQRSDSDISPRTVDPPRDSTSVDPKTDYFPDLNTVDGSNTSVRASDGDDSSAHKSSISFAPDTREGRSSSRESNQNPAQGQDSMIHRKSSTGSVSFRRMTNPQLPQGNPQQMNSSRIRASSPEHTSLHWGHRNANRDRLTLSCYLGALYASAGHMGSKATWLEINVTTYQASRRVNWATPAKSILSALATIGYLAKADVSIAIATSTGFKIRIKVCKLKTPIAVMDRWNLALP
ncbi:hypothetical protein F53441_24 [Fusarium austroafricanum]|uniref:Uncharacterized protein n=1 Tax=Fusarium austroafricanum TaxID=2364996 RepID=A0A8H4KZA6_9HYPO|nr:hypothetical protein F53441_24 [Fusarium austroafricanum]